MATKVTPKQTEKTNVKSADKEKLAAERAKLIEKSLPACIKSLEANFEAEAAVPTSFLDVVDIVSKEVVRNEFTSDETRTLTRRAIVEAFNATHPKAAHITVEGLTKNPSLNSNVSRIVSLACPKSDKIAEQIEAAREKGVGVVALSQVASGKLTAAQAAKSQGRGGNVAQKSKNKEALDKGIESVDVLSDAIVKLMGKGVKGGISTVDILTCSLNAYLFLTTEDETYKDQEDDDKRAEVIETFDACLEAEKATEKSAK